ncbi:MAG: thioredoxin domain-containing protein [Patescibacteria group bacterium]
MEHDKIQKEGNVDYSKKNNLTVPVAIVIAGALIAGAVYFSSGKSNLPTLAGDAIRKQQPSQGNTTSLDQMASISTSDHLRGNPDAPVKIVEYSDLECPFCKRFHETMQQVMDEYGKSGKVAWVYRHFPLDQLHSKARNEAAATECANELGGNDKYWSYLDRLFEITPSNNNLDPAELSKIAQYIGLDIQKFNACLSSGKYAKHIEDDVQNAQATGGNGTPWSIIVAKNGKKYPLSGAQPYEAVKQLIELALQEK